MRVEAELQFLGINYTVNLKVKVARSALSQQGRFEYPQPKKYNHSGRKRRVTAGSSSLHTTCTTGSCVTSAPSACPAIRMNQRSVFTRARLLLLVPVHSLALFSHPPFFFLFFFFVSIPLPSTDLLLPSDQASWKTSLSGSQKAGLASITLPACACW